MTRDPDEERIGSIVVPVTDIGANRPRHANTGFVHAHSESLGFGEGNLSGKRIAFERFSEREFTWNELRLCIVDELDVLMVLED